jgi:cytochrome P450 family 2 subfamily U polypeptide 1
MLTTFTCIAGEQLCVMCMDLFLAGTETTSGLLGYCIRYMVQHPAVQSKLRHELLLEVGAQRLPSMDDMSKYVMMHN